MKELEKNIEGILDKIEKEFHKSNDEAIRHKLSRNSYSAEAIATALSKDYVRRDEIEIDTDKVVNRLKDCFNSVAYELNNGDSGNDEETIASAISSGYILKE